ncbi:hypothetical protein [Bartonella tamiae]|nr:hypothetical protein [Bartonella tamiae]
MSKAYVSYASEMATIIIKSEFKGAGDTIEAAAYRAERKYKAPASILMRLRHRASEMKDMKVSSWFAVFEAYQRACVKAERKYEAMRAENETNPLLVSVSDFVAGREAEKEKIK